MKNTERVQTCYEALNQGDVEKAISFFAKDIAWSYPNGMGEPSADGVRHGADEVRDLLLRNRERFSLFRFAPQEYLDFGDRVVVFGNQRSRGRSTELECTVEFAHSWRLDDGKVTHFTDYHDSVQERQVLSPQEVPAPDPLDGMWHVIRTGLGFWDAKVLMAAMELGVFADLAERPGPTPDELTSRLGLHPRGARDFFDALVALRLLNRDGGRYYNTGATNVHLNPARPEMDVGGLLGFVHGKFYETWKDLPTALRTGEPQSDITAGGMDAFEALYADPERVRRFQRAMHGGSLGAKLVIADKFPWAKYRTVADIGSVAGPLLIRLLTARPHLRGIGFDLPPVEPWFEQAVAEAGLSDRLTFVAGDFFSDPMPSADVIVLGHVLHDWDLPTKRMLLDKAFEALPPGGAVVVYDSMIDDDRKENIHGLLTSLHMLLVSPGGFDYTGQDCLDWLTDAGFQGCHVVHLAGPESLAAGFKPSTDT
jgi:ketosteroid isomerase-like protein